jgi:hypothetical protein
MFINDWIVSPQYNFYYKIIVSGLLVKMNKLFVHTNIVYNNEWVWKTYQVKALAKSRD